VSTQWTKTTRVRVTQDTELASADGYRVAIGDTQYGNITLTLPAHAADEGVVEILKEHASNTLTVDCAGSDTINGQDVDVEMSDIGESLLLIPGNSEWLCFSPLTIS